LKSTLKSKFYFKIFQTGCYAFVKKCEIYAAKFNVNYPDQQGSDLTFAKILNQKPTFTKTKNYEAKFTEKLDGSNHACA